MWNLKRNDTNELIYKTNRLTDLENKLMVTNGASRRRREINNKFEIDMYTLLYVK